MVNVDLQTKYNIYRINKVDIGFFLEKIVTDFWSHFFI